MRIGNVRIAGVSKRFYFVILGVIVALVILIKLVSALAPKPAPNLVAYTPAYFTASALTQPAAQTGGWLGKFISDYGLWEPSAESDFTGLEGYAENVGRPLRFKAYVSDPSDVSATRPDLSLTEDDYTFEPAQFIAPDEITSLSELAGNDESALGNQPLELGFRNGAVPPPDQAYEITGLLWWRSDLLESGTPSGQLASPVILVDSWELLSPEELQAPTTQRADLNLSYQEDGQTVSLNRVEWSAGNELRVCISVTNDTAQTEPLWAGVSSMTADNGNGTVTGTPDPNGALANTSQLQAYQSVPGYIDFSASASDASLPLILRMPTINAAADQGASAQDLMIVKVPTSSIENVANIQAPTTNCLNSGAGTSSS
jgi:hypothetical protein